MAFRILGGLLGAFFFLQGLSWIFDAQGAAEGLGMPLLDGIARSTQVGDLTGFFLCLGGFGLWGAYQQSPTWLRASGFLLFGAALGRTLAAVVSGADFATQYIGIEIVTGGLFFLAGAKVGAPPTTE
ncbi:MAG: hypothetical protein CL931_01605 [Deltaproteobacteria bacterium]|nr:hypothetical protein [Deltaproteobacteria bacterium]